MRVLANMGGNMTNILSFPHLDLKLGNMRKAQDFLVNPYNKGDVEIILQSDKRICRVNLETGAAVLSNGKGGHQGFAQLNKFLGAVDIQFSDEQLEQVRQAVGWTPAE